MAEMIMDIRQCSKTYGASRRKRTGHIDDSLKGIITEYSARLFKNKKAPAVDDFNYTVNSGRFIALIGESGSGKTTIGRMILRLLKPTSGSIVYQGRDIIRFKRRELKSYYRDVQGIFQDPFSSFNPLFKIDRVFNMVFDSFLPGEKDRKKKIAETIQSVDMNPKEILGKYPHQLSGGQLQRLLIVRALLMNVKLLVADELISMLDASTRIGILNLLGTLTRERGMTVLFITHDLSLGYYISDETMIMHRGRIVECGDSRRVFNNPRHPYTRMLLASVPDIAQKWNEREVFIPEALDIELKAFYEKNSDSPKGLVEIEPDHRVILTL
jgi:peptide/nickel transport system ATP-binding protein